MGELEFIKEFKSRFSGKLDRSKIIDLASGPSYPFLVEEEGNAIGCMYLHFEPSMRPPMVWVIYLKAYGKRKGNGSKMLRMLCRFADEAGIRLYLESVADPGGPLAGVQLVNWYKRYGFQGDVVMEREPHA